MGRRQNSTEPTWAGSLLAMPRRERILLAVVAVLGIALLVFLAVWGSSRQAPRAVAQGSELTTAAPAVVAQPQLPSTNEQGDEKPGPPTVQGTPPGQVDHDVAPAPGMDPDLAPPDGPGPDTPPFGVDALAMREELRGHGVDLKDGDLYKLVDAANKYIAEDDLDLDAWDPRIMKDVKSLWPNLDKGRVIDVTRCTAEYVERVEARNHGLPHPPDEDDHNVVVEGRGSQPRVSHGN